MKKLITFPGIFFILFFAHSTVQSQPLVWTEPAFPTDSDHVIVYFDASMGSGGLAGYTGDIYAHTGVITENSTSGSDWKYVISDWGVNIPKAKLTCIGTDLYSLDITPIIRSFYGVPTGEKILKMAFVFRSGVQVGGSWLEGKTNTGGDIFIDIYESGLNVSIENPAQSMFVNLNETIPVKAVAIDADSMILYVNGIREKAVASNLITDTINASNYGKFWIKVVAFNSTDRKSDSVYFYVLSTPTVADPPQGTAEGINYINDSTVILLLYAPSKEFVFVIGDFNNWEADSSGFMNKTSDGNTYWIQINNLQASKEYIFQYWVDGQILIGDPYADKVSDPWNDQHIDNATYPNLVSYPAGKTSGIATVLQTAQTPFAWQVTNFTPPAVTDLVIYEILIRDFTAEHTYQSVIDTLPYLKRLGINAIELMPFSEFEGNSSWGYNPNYYFAPDKYYGTKNSLKSLIDECHRNGIAVIQDMVLNHSFGTSPLVMLYWDAANNHPATDNPWFNTIAKHDYNVGYDMNHESLATQNFVKKVVTYWLEEYNVDGFRFDLSKGFTQKNTLGNTSAWGQYDATRIAIWNRYNNDVKAVKPNAYVILEHFADNSEETELANNGMMLWGNSNYNYCQASMGWISTSDLSWASYKNRGWNQPNLVSYMESHDEERVMYKNITYGNTSNSSYNIKDMTIALQRQQLTGAFFFTIPGPKMIWQFGEMGYDYSINWPSLTSNDRLTPKPPRWDYMNDFRRNYLNKFWSALISLKKEHAALKSTDFSMSVAGAVKTILINHSEMNLRVIGNFDVIQQTASVNFGTGNWWYDYFAGDSLQVTGTTAFITLQPGEFRIYTTKKLAKPEIGTGISDFIPNGEVVVYPNPSSTIFYFAVEEKAIRNYNLIIYNSMGEKIAEVSGAHLLPLQWNAATYNNGVYFYRLQTDKKVQSGVLVKN